MLFSLTVLVLLQERRTAPLPVAIMEVPSNISNVVELNSSLAGHFWCHSNIFVLQWLRVHHHTGICLGCAEDSHKKPNLITEEGLHLRGYESHLRLTTKAKVLVAVMKFRY
jgi:hypothetical protein